MKAGLSKRKLKLLHVVFSLNTGGLEKLVLELVKGVNSERIETSVCCLTDEGDLSKDFREFDAKLFYCRKRKGIDFSLYFKIFNLIRRHDFDIVHTHDSSTLLYATIAAKLAGVKRIINTQHGDICFETTRKRTLMKYLSLSNSKIVCVSEMIKNELQALGVSDQRLTVILNGIDLASFSLEGNDKCLRKEIGLTDNDFVIISVGRLSEEKNHETIIDAFLLLQSFHSHLKLLLVGDGPRRKYLEEYVSKKGLTEKVCFLGTRKDVPVILKASNCFVMASRYESFGLAALEAMAMEVPVIATQAGGVSDLLCAGKFGELVSIGDSKGIAKAVTKLLENPTESKERASKAKEFVFQNFSIDKMIQAYEKMYLETFC